MKSIIRLIILSCFIVGVSATSFNMTQNNQRIGLSLADIAVIAKAGDETGGNVVQCYSACSLSLLHAYYDCGTCRRYLGMPMGGTLTCVHTP